MARRIREHKPMYPTPQMLRDLADKIEKEEAYGRFEYRIDHEMMDPIYGNDVQLYGHRYQTRHFIDRIINIEIKLIGPKEFLLPNGDWV